MKVLRKKSIKTSILKKFTRYEDVQKTKYKPVDIEEVTREREKLTRYIENNATTQVWREDKTLIVPVDEKEEYL